MATLKDLSSQLRQLQKQIPFATAQAMTKVVRQIEAAQKQHLSGIWIIQHLLQLNRLGQLVPGKQPSCEGVCS